MKLLYFTLEVWIGDSVICMKFLFTGYGIETACSIYNIYCVALL